MFNSNILSCCFVEPRDVPLASTTTHHLVTNIVNINFFRIDLDQGHFVKKYFHVMLIGSTTWKLDYTKVVKENGPTNGSHRNCTAYYYLIAKKKSYY